MLYLSYFTTAMFPRYHRHARESNPSYPNWILIAQAPYTIMVQDTKYNLWDTKHLTLNFLIFFLSASHPRILGKNYFIKDCQEAKKPHDNEEYSTEVWAPYRKNERKIYVALRHLRGGSRQWRGTQEKDLLRRMSERIL